MTGGDRTIVVGGGLAGVAAFYELVRRGREAVLIEARSSLAGGASFANGGMLTPSLPAPWNSPGVGGHLFQSLFSASASIRLRPHAIPALSRWGLQFIRNAVPARFRRATQANYMLASYSVAQTERVLCEDDIRFSLNGSGTLKVFRTPAAFEAQKRLAAQLEPLGLRYDVLDREAVAAKEPQLSDVSGNYLDGLYFPDDRAGDACAFTRALGERARALGGALRLDEKILRINVENGRVAGVDTDRGRIEARRVVVAAGAATPRLARRAGVRVPIAPAKGYSLTIDMAGWNVRPATTVVDEAARFCATPLGDRLRCVAIAEFTGEDERVDPARTAYLYDHLDRLYPALAASLDRDKVLEWAGLRPMSADGVPFIGAAGPEGLWINAGHGHLGWTMAMGSAVLLADLMTGAAPAIDPRPFEVLR